MLHIPASRTAACFALLALVPFIVCAACLWFVAPEWQARFTHILVAYAALVLAFTGGIHWGKALLAGDEPSDIWQYLYGVMPAMLAWVVLNCQPGPGLFLLFLGYLATFTVDRRLYEGRYLVLRGIMTGVICLSLYAGYKAL